MSSWWRELDTNSSANGARPSQTDPNALYYISDISYVGSRNSKRLGNIFDDIPSRLFIKAELNKRLPSIPVCANEPAEDDRVPFPAADPESVPDSSHWLVEEECWGDSSKAGFCHYFHNSILGFQPFLCFSTVCKPSSARSICWAVYCSGIAHSHWLEPHSPDGTIQTFTHRSIYIVFMFQTDGGVRLSRPVTPSDDQIRNPLEENSLIRIFIISICTFDIVSLLSFRAASSCSLSPHVVSCVSLLMSLADAP